MRRTAHRTEHTCPFSILILSRVFLNREWFRTYKIPDGKPENKFGLEGRCMNAAYAMHVVDEVRHRKYLLGLYLSLSRPLPILI